MDPELKKIYDESIPDKLLIFKGLTDAFKNSTGRDTTLAAALNLRNISHKVAGSAGSYGYDKASDLCRKMELTLIQFIENVEKDPQAPVSSPDVEQFLNELKAAFDFKPAEKEVASPPESAAPKKPKERPFAYIVNNDRHFLDAVEQNETKYGIDAITEWDPQKAIEKLSEEDFHPQIVIVSHQFERPRLSGEEVLRQIRKKTGSTPPKLGMFIDSEDIKTRIEVMQNGIEYIFHWPVAPEILLSDLENILRTEHSIGFKVLIVDDDVDLCRFLTSILNEKGMEVKSLGSGDNLFQTLTLYQPNCLLLDLNLPGYNGLEILKALKADVRYARLSIVIITSRAEKETREEAYAAKVDDILFKPLDKKLVQTRIYNLAMQHHEQYDHLAETDALTGLPTARALYFFLHHKITHPERQGTPPLLALVEIENFSALKLQIATSDLQKIVITTAYSLSHHLKESLFTSYLGKGRFALVHGAKDLPHFIENLSRSLLLGIHEVTQYSETLPEITYSCGVTSLSPHVKHVDDAIKAAEEALEEALHGPERTAPITVKLHQINEHTYKEKTEVVLIDTDQYLLEVLSAAFKAQGVKVTTFTSGKEAQKNLLERNISELPSLILSDRNLVDLDGLEILKSLKKKQPLPPPFIFLSTFSSEKDVFDGLNEGAQDYITKPFNLEIVMKKAQALLF